MLIAILKQEAQDFLTQIVVKTGNSGFSSRKTGRGIFAASHVGTSVGGVGRTLGWQGRRQAAAPVGSVWQKVTSASLEV